MNEVFISYARADRPRAQRLAQALEQQGWSIWWDRHIPPGKTFAQVIEGSIETAKCVLVLWSKTSVKSDWVQSEAGEGKRRGILVPVLIDSLQEVDIPLEFRRIQAADLIDWNGSTRHQGFADLIEAMTSLLGQPAQRAAQQGVQNDHGADALVQPTVPLPPAQRTRPVETGAPPSPAKQEVSVPARRSSAWIAAVSGAVIAAAFVIIGQQYFSPPQSDISGDQTAQTGENSASAQSQKTAAKPDKPDKANKPATRQQELARLLVVAEKQFAGSQLTTPAGNNAFETYQRVLRLDAKNETAQVGIQKIKQQYLVWAEHAVKKSGFQRARIMYEKALSVDPQDAALRITLQKVTQREQKDLAKLTAEKAEEDKRKQEEARKRRDTQLSQLGFAYTRQDFLNSARSGNLRAVKIFLDAGMTPNTTGSTRVTPLMYAAANGHVQVVRLLVKYRANVNAQDDKGKTALMHATATGQTAIVGDLIANKAALDTVNTGGGTALMYAAWKGHTEVVKTLLDHGAAIGAQDNTGWTALINAARNGHTDTVRLLLAKGADIYATTKAGETALRQASVGKHREVTALLRKAGAKL